MFYRNATLSVSIIYLNHHLPETPGFDVNYPADSILFENFDLINDARAVKQFDVSGVTFQAYALFDVSHINPYTWMKGSFGRGGT